MQHDHVDISSLRPGLRARVDLYLVSLGLGFNAGLAYRDRLHDLIALDSLSDAQLIAMGLDRTQIPAFVFSDLLAPPQRPV
ncbi:hypothetical protein [Falsiphaeobacter marinintestinus]|uniref:hypothetical protein n=1 Tax=Falsiphaeobacter marinintestinus TaxID=1492905 RepID=UPI0011B712E5|nr:hypothetical protein [Phaeobacter marinintestinus]